jgi:hypothetical protein
MEANKAEERQSRPTAGRLCLSCHLNDEKNVAQENLLTGFGKI